MDTEALLKQLRGFARPLAKVVLTVFLGMLVFELVQGLLWPDQSPWQSHAAEVIYAAILAGTVGYFALRMHAVLYQQVLEKNEKYEKSEAELRRNKEWFRALTEHGSDLITVIDPNGTILYDSPSIERILGYRPIDRQGKSGFDLVHPEDIPGARSIIERAFQKLGSTHTIAMRVRGLDGRWHVLEATGKAILDHDGKLRVIINSRDITERKQAEQKIAESREMLHRIVNHIPQHVFWKDRESNYLGCNQLFAESAGVGEPAAIVGKTDFDLAWKETAELYRADDRTVMETNTPKLDFEERQTRPDGSVLWLRTSKVPLQDRDGKVFGILGIYADITERKQAHQAIKVLAKFPEQNPHPILRVAQDGTLLYANAASHALLETWHCLPEKPIPEWWRNLVIRALASGQPHTTEVEIGGLVYFFTIVPIADEGYANIYALDITERKQAEEALRRQEEHFRSLIENIQDIITILNPDGTISYQSPSLERVLGYTPEELVGRSAFEFIHEDERPRVLEALQQAVGNPGSTASAEFRFQGKDGAWRHLESIGKSLAGVSGSLSVIVTSRDITERKQLELKARQLARLAALGQLIGGIAHELKNPLFILTGRIQMAREKLAQQEYADLGSDLEIIGDVGHRMKTITDRFVAIAKPVPPRQEQCSVQAILHQSLESLAHELTQNKIRVETAFAPDLPGIQSDPRQLHEVFLNLMQNAVQAMTHVPGERRLTVSAAREGTWIVARMQDNGPGIAPEHRAKLFEPFFSTAEQGKGPGLGLWIVRSTLMMLRGEVLCESEVGKGTTFIVRLPVST